MNKKFMNSIHQLQQNNIVVLRSCRSLSHAALLAQLARSYSYVDLSLPLPCLQARRNPQAFVQSLQLPVYLDNLQYVPQLLPALAQSAVPRTQLLASCTQSFALVKEAEKLTNVCFVDLPTSIVTAQEGACPECLAASSNDVEQKSIYEETIDVGGDGQLVPVEQLAPFSLAKGYLEALSKRKPVNVLDALWQGQRSAYGGSYDAYLQKVLQSDIMFLTTVSSSEKFYCFMEVAATMTGRLVNYVKLAQSAGITPPTAKTWLKFLLGTGIVYTLHPVQHIGLKRIVSTPKLYFRDTGLACELLGLDAASVSQSEYLPQLEQNYALNKIRESYINERIFPSLRFYKDNNKKHIDVILRKDGVLYPMMLAAEPLDAERVQFAFEVLTEYAAGHDFMLGNGCIICPEGDTKELLPGLWQLGAQRL